MLFIRQEDNFAFWLLLLAVSVFGLAMIAQVLLVQNDLHHFISQTDTAIDNAHRDSLSNFPAPAVVLGGDNSILWYNNAFTSQIFDGKDSFGQVLSEIMDGLDMQKVRGREGQILPYKDKYFRLLAADTQQSDAVLTLLYFEDVTDYVILQREYSQTRPSVVLIMIDNYDDLMQDVRDMEKASVLVRLEKLFEDFMEGSTGVLRKLSSDRFIAILEEKQLARMEETRYDILDKARSIMVADKLPVTLSIGVGRGGRNMRESETLARQALDMALGRGGDQAAVKTDNGYTFFGGVSKGIEKHAKVKTRIIATALLELIENTEQVLIMGHRFGDLDSIGSAVGLGGAIHTMGRPVHVVVDPQKNLAGNLIDRIKSAVDFDLFITPAEAMELIDYRTLLVIVDTHNKGLVESVELYQKASHIAVIDHHRKVTNFIDNAVLFHHEPYASSASEMVAELLQYFEGANRMPAHYAEAMLAGIMLDTKSFVMRTGVRTFEAAAFLRKLGADTMSVRNLFGSSLDTYQKKTRLVASAELYQKRCAIAVSDFTCDDIRIVAPQAADELLNISGVDASFVVFDVGGTLNISARSMGGMNVQLVMEKLGGGGHQTMAATQLADTTVEEGVTMLKNAIDEHIRQSS